MKSFPLPSMHQHGRPGQPGGGGGGGGVPQPQTLKETGVKFKIVQPHLQSRMGDEAPCMPYCMQRAPHWKATGLVEGVATVIVSMNGIYDLLQNKSVAESRRG